jgi:hypothetical protein
MKRIGLIVKWLPLTSLMLCICAPLAGAQSGTNPGQGYTRFDEHTVYHSVFNSTMVQPDIAQLHQITRAGDRVLVNIALVANDKQGGGLAARVSGSATNLMQQRTALAFKAIDEGDVVYYLAPLRISNGEFIHFNIHVEPEGTGGPYTIKFSKQLYVDKS